MHRALKPISLSMAMLAAGCASWDPTWSELSGERYHRAIENRRLAILVAIGDRRVFSAPYKVEPGTWNIVVESPPHDGFRGTEQTLRLTVEPCKRYYINAQFASPIGPEWMPVIDYVEDIAGCTRPESAK